MKKSNEEKCINCENYVDYKKTYPKRESEMIKKCKYLIPIHKSGIVPEVNSYNCNFYKKIT